MMASRVIGGLTTQAESSSTPVRVCLPNAHVEQPRRANASRRSARTCCWAAYILSRDDGNRIEGFRRQGLVAP